MPNPCTEAVGDTAARRAGLRYEAHAVDYLRKVFGTDFIARPFVHFRDDSGHRTVIPDGLYANPGSRPGDRYLVAIEVKIQHMPEAWWQLTQLYKPVLGQFARVENGFSRTWKVFCLEICRSFDPAMPFPEKVHLVNDLEVFARDPSPGFNVLQWRP